MAPPSPRYGGSARYLCGPILEELRRLGAQNDLEIAVRQQQEANGCGDCEPASAASFASLETHKYGSGGAVSDGVGMCVICREDFEVGDDLILLPCKNRHRFHRSCLVRWLARSRYCPLCRHALPAAGDDLGASSQ